MEFFDMSTVATCKLLVTDNNKLSLIISLPLNVNVIKFVKKYAVKSFVFTMFFASSYGQATTKCNWARIRFRFRPNLTFEIRPNPVPAGFGKTESGAALVNKGMQTANHGLVKHQGEIQQTLQLMLA